MFTQDNYEKNNTVFVEGNKYVSKPIKVNFKNLENSFYRVDLELYGVLHNNSSYEGRVFIDNPKADINTLTNPENGFAGSFYAFGHGGVCYGDKGHCKVPESQNHYDLRRSHPLTPLYIQVEITEAVKKLADKEEIIITIVPAVKKDDVKMQNLSETLQFEKLSIVTYDWPKKR